MQQMSEEAQVSRLKKGHIQGKKPGCERERRRKSRQIGGVFALNLAVTPDASGHHQRIREPRRDRNQQVRPVQIPGTHPCSELLQAINKKRGDKQVAVRPESGGRKADEVTPNALSQAEPNRGEIHPGLEEMQPADARVPDRREEQNRDETAAADQDEPLWRAGIHG